MVAVALPMMALDLHVPTLPMMASYFHVSNAMMKISAVSIIAFATFAFYFPETHAYEQRVKFSLLELVSKYRAVLTNKRFLIYALVHGLPSSAMWCFITIIPFVLINHMGVEVKHVGYYITPIALVLSLTSYYVKKRVIKKGTDSVMSIGIKLLFVGGMATMAAALLAPTSPVLAIVCLLAYPMGIQFTFPTSVAKAMTFATLHKGTGSASLTTLRMAFAVLGSFVAVLLPDASFFATGVFMMLVASLTAFCVVIVKSRWSE